MHFNLLEKPWIPVADEDGNIKETGILDVLKNAHHYKEIAAGNLLEEYSIIRFLHAFLMDAIRPMKTGDIEDLLEEGQFDEDVIDKYVALCESEGTSFDLLDEEHPFMQASFDKKEEKDSLSEITQLDLTAPSGTYHCFYEPRALEEISYTPAEAARKLISDYVFTRYRGRGYYPGPNSFKSTTPCYNVISGTNLFETLVFTLVPMKVLMGQNYNEVGKFNSFDAPQVFWRRKDNIEKGTLRKSTSYLGGLLFPSLRIRLVPNDKKDLIINVLWSFGEHYDSESGVFWRDPFITYKKEESKKGTKFSAVMYHSDSPLWNNLNTMIDISNSTFSFFLLRQYLDITDADRKNVRVITYGLEKTEYSPLKAMGRSDMEIPRNIIGNDICLSLITKALSMAARCKRVLSKGLMKVYMIGLPKDPDKKDSLSRAYHHQRIQEFNNKCESRLWQLCKELSEQSISYKDSYKNWVTGVLSDALMIFNEVISTVTIRAKHLSDYVEADRYRGREFGQIRKEEIGNDTNDNTDENGNSEKAG